MTRPTLLLLAAATLAGPLAAQGGCTPTVTGELRLHTLASTTFGNSRTIRVLLPAGYDEPANANRRYPVLYLLDGQNLFDKCLSGISHQEWGVDETVDRLVRAGTIPPMIVVGIDNTGMSRAKEFLPYRDQVFNADLAEVEGDRFPDFLVHEVLPLVNGAYRTETGHDHTGIGGSSYGGVAALYALLARPREFGYGLVESAPLQIGMGQLLRDTRPLTAWPNRVFFGMGGAETDDAVTNDRLIGLVRAVEANFRDAGYDDRSVRLVVTPGARHTESAWAGRLAGALTFLYGR